MCIIVSNYYNLESLQKQKQKQKKAIYCNLTYGRSKGI